MNSETEGHIQFFGKSILLLFLYMLLHFPKKLSKLKGLQLQPGVFLRLLFPIITKKTDIENY